MVSALIIDDELLARENLKLLVTEFCEGIEIVGLASNVNEAKAMIALKNPDVIFLDIRMPSGAEGFDLLDSLEEINFETVFVTAFKDYAIQAFKANAIDYLLKPVAIDELQETAKRIVQKLSGSPIIEDKKERISSTFESIRNQKIERIAISHQKGIKLISVRDIIRLQSNGNYTEIYFLDGSKFVDSRTMKVYQEMLPNDLFLRIHNSHIVNLSCISEYSTEDGNFVILKNKESIPVSRANLPSLMEYFRSV